LFYLSEPLFVSKPWGGNLLGDIYQKENPKNIGEVWLLSGYPKKETPIFSIDGRESTPNRVVRKVTGMNLPRFPFLIKMLNAREWLSVQVHPDNGYAKKNEQKEPWGKNELWYVLEAKKNARIIDGIKSISSKKEMIDKLEQANNGTKEPLEKHLNYTELKKHELIYLQAGKVHALGPDSVILEVQQTSDLTYRLYDWGRKRPLHLQKGSEVINYRYPIAEKKNNPNQYRNDYFYFLKKKIDEENPAGETINGFSVLITLTDCLIDEFEVKQYFPIIVPHHHKISITGEFIELKLGRWWERHGEER